MHSVDLLLIGAYLIVTLALGLMPARRTGDAAEYLAVGPVPITCAGTPACGAVIGQRNSSVKSSST